MDVNLNSVISTSTDYTKNVSTVKEEKTSDTKKEEAKKDVAATYEKSENTGASTYKINKMSVEDRKALVNQLKQDAQDRQQSLIDLAKDMISKQSQVFATASDDNVWKFLASGKFSVDEATKKKAQEDISENGYYGVKQTSQRLFDFASALAGDDVDNMKKMQAAVEKGYKKAEKMWGGKLPEISQKTLEATNKLFEDYYNSKKEVVKEEA